MKYIVRFNKQSGRWAIYQRHGNKSNKATDEWVRDVELGLHVAERICHTMNKYLHTRSNLWYDMLTD